MQKVLVTGASGFIGAHVVQTLASEGLSIRCLVRRESRLDFIMPYSPELAYGDITMPETLAPALDGVQAVVHCAGLTKAITGDYYRRVNAEGTRHLLEACSSALPGIKSVVHLSSLAAIGPSTDGQPVTETTLPRPVSDYGISKLAGHRIAESFQASLPLTILVPPAVFGPYDRDFYVYFRSIKYNIMPFIGRKPRYVSLIYAKDLARAIFLCLHNHRASGKTFLVDDGTVQTWESMAGTISRAMGKNPMCLRVPEWLACGIARMVGASAKVTRKAPLLNAQKMNEFLQPAWTCSSVRIRSELGFRPAFTLEQAVEETRAWYFENQWL